MRKLALKELALMLAAVMIVGISLEAQTPVGAEAAGAAISPDVAAKLAQARLATAKYATDLARAKADGYTIITPMIPNMGYHFLNPKISGFDITKPPILVYVRRGDAWQLVAIEWVWPKKPATVPLRGARYGSFGRPATTRMARSSWLRPKRSARRRTPRREPHSPSGTRRSSRCTCGSGIRTRTGSSGSSTLS